MGPRSDNRGYVCQTLTASRRGFNGSTVREPWLCRSRLTHRARRLQWVHGPITVVMLHPHVTDLASAAYASMGPRSENRGYGPASLPGIGHEVKCPAASGRGSDACGGAWYVGHIDVTPCAMCVWGSREAGGRRERG